MSRYNLVLSPGSGCGRRAGRAGLIWDINLIKLYASEELMFFFIIRAKKVLPLISTERQVFRTEDKLDSELCKVVYIQQETDEVSTL